MGAPLAAVSRALSVGIKGMLTYHVTTQFMVALIIRCISGSISLT